MTITVWCSKGVAFDSKEAAERHAEGTGVFERKAVRLPDGVYVLTGPLAFLNIEGKMIR